ncbi:hypothetical protein CRENBAI_013093 [Crenichthys baileyi]|uniref:Uncharacterized protein n=1 Tax=Crenichthys baileyi TaxID=28760 RepID=A0AAV9SBB4_9TELE
MQTQGGVKRGETAVFSCYVYWRGGAEPSSSDSNTLIYFSHYEREMQQTQEKKVSFHQVAENKCCSVGIAILRRAHTEAVQLRCSCCRKPLTLGCSQANNGSGCGNSAFWEFMRELALSLNE